MRIDLRYVCRFRYGAAVSESHNAVRVCPATTGSQRLLSYRIAVEPDARILSYVDYWGTRVDTFGVPVDHAELVVAADASVESEAPPPPGDGAPWRGPRPAGDRLADIEFLSSSPHVRWGSEVAGFAADAAAGAATLVEACRAVEEAISARMTYEAGVTEVGTPVDDVFAAGRGVCQDYAHLALACYRSLGIPARYVSGYFAAGGDDGSAGDVETHAWVEVAVDGHGWWAIDPTNRTPVDGRYVKIGHGRDYEDVTPLRGAYSGPRADAELEVAVTVNPRPGDAPSGASPRSASPRSRPVDQ